jgi:hypothetical protein
MRTQSSLSIVGLGFFALASSMVTIHCGSDSDPGAASPGGADAGVVEDPAPEDDALPRDADGGAEPDVASGDGGTVDSGAREPATITVCGGSKGDPTAVPVLDWKVYSYKPKYAVKLGVDGLYKNEPIFWSSNAVVVDGTRTDIARLNTKSALGTGPWDTRSLVADDFANGAMPRTDLQLAEKRLGWTDTVTSLFRLRTEWAVQGWKDFRVAGKASHVTASGWLLEKARRRPFANGAYDYVTKIFPSRGMGWFFTVVFDHPCKAAAFDAMVGSDVLAIVAPPPPRTRAEVSKFLVDNNARLLLTAATFGGDDPAIRATLTGTRASAASLDALESTLDAFSAAMTAFGNTSGLVDYEILAAGISLRWVTGEVYMKPIASLPE